MNHRYPLRTFTHRLEELSERHFRTCLPENWMASKPEHDYGIDLRVEMPEEDFVTGLSFLVQLKATANSDARDYETVNLDVSTYNHLWERLEVVMLVKYVRDNNEAYWLLLSEVPKPKQENQSFTIRMPKIVSYQRLTGKVYMTTYAK